MAYIFLSFSEHLDRSSNNKNEFYALFIDVSQKKYNKIIEFITMGKDN